MIRTNRVANLLMRGPSRAVAVNSLQARWAVQGCNAQYGMISSLPIRPLTNIIHKDLGFGEGPPLHATNAETDSSLPEESMDVLREDAEKPRYRSYRMSREEREKRDRRHALEYFRDLAECEVEGRLVLDLRFKYALKAAKSFMKSSHKSKKLIEVYLAVWNALCDGQGNLVPSFNGFGYSTEISNFFLLGANSILNSMVTSEMEGIASMPGEVRPQAILEVLAKVIFNGVPSLEHLFGTNSELSQNPQHEFWKTALEDLSESPVVRQRPVHELNLPNFSYIQLKEEMLNPNLKHNQEVLAILLKKFEIDLEIFFSLLKAVKEEGVKTSYDLFIPNPQGTGDFFLRNFDPTKDVRVQKFYFDLINYYRIINHSRTLVKPEHIFFAKKAFSLMVEIEKYPQILGEFQKIPQSFFLINKITTLHRHLPHHIFRSIAPAVNDTYDYVLKTSNLPLMIPHYHPDYQDVEYLNPRLTKEVTNSMKFERILLATNVINAYLRTVIYRYREWKSDKRLRYDSSFQKILPKIEEIQVLMQNINKDVEEVNASSNKRSQVFAFMITKMATVLLSLETKGEARYDSIVQDESLSFLYKEIVNSQTKRTEQILNYFMDNTHFEQLFDTTLSMAQLEHWRVTHELCKEQDIEVIGRNKISMEEIISIFPDLHQGFNLIYEQLSKTQQLKPHIAVRALVELNDNKLLFPNVLRSSNVLDKFEIITRYTLKGKTRTGRDFTVLQGLGNLGLEIHRVQKSDETLELFNLIAERIIAYHKKKNFANKHFLIKEYEKLNGIK